MPPLRERSLIAFCHIPKTAGQSMVDILRRNFGTRHVDCKRRGKGRNALYYAHDLAMDLRLYPRARSLHGHYLRPWLDYGTRHHDLRWYTVVRDPIKRFASQYQYAREVLGKDGDLSRYVGSQRSLNVMVNYLSGSEDLQGAKDILEHRFAGVGMVEDFKGSLLMLREALGHPAMDVRFVRPKNVARSPETRLRIEEEMERQADLIAERTALDQALFLHVTRHIWPAQVRAYGQERLDHDRERVFGQPPAAVGILRRFGAATYRNAIYTPVVALDKARSSVRRLPTAPQASRS